MKAMDVGTGVSFPTRAQTSTLVAGLALACLWSVVLARDADFETFAFASLLAGPFVTALALVFGCGLLILAPRWESPRARIAGTWSATSAFVVAFIALGGFLQIPARVLWAYSCEAPTLAWSDEVVGRIQTFEAVHGVYPPTLSDLGELHSPWWALELDYHSSESGFTLMVGPPYHGSGEDPRSGFSSHGCRWIVRGDDGSPRTPLPSVPYWERLRYLQGE